MNPAHVHLLFNHFPIVGTIFSSIVLAFGVFRYNVTVIQTGLCLFIFTGLLSIPVFLSGDGAKDILASIGQKNETLISAHEKQADKVFWFCEATGIFSAIVLFMLRKKNKRVVLFSSIVLLTGVINIYLLVETGNTGGQIRHSEIRPTN